MSTMIAARPTTYKGIKMRSRLEAKYAASLDEDGWEWSYEPRAYANEHGQYLPDFEIQPEADDPEPIVAYAEVRPTLAGVYRAMEQMPIIWSSEPDATLMVVIPDQGLLWWTSGRLGDGRWRMWREPS